MSKRYETGIFVLRLVAGLTFLLHGIAKYQSGVGSIAGWFESIGLAGFIAYLVAIIEVFGGIAVILGFATRVVSVLFAVIMVGAIVKVKLAAGFLGGFELELALLAISVHLAISGSRLLSVDNLLFRPVSEEFQS